MTPEFFESLANARTKPDMSAAIGAMSVSMGFPLYTMMYAGFAGCGAPESIVVSNVPLAFDEASRDPQASRRDPVLRKLRSRTTPFIYTQATYTDNAAGDLWEEQAAYGYRNGIAMGLRLGRGRRFLIGFDTPDPITNDESKRSMLLAQLAATAVIAAMTCDRIVGDAMARSGVAALTPREAEVIPLLAKGLTGPQIGEILQLSGRTVEKHIQGAMKKLGASRQAELISAAMRMDILDDGFLINH